MTNIKKSFDKNIPIIKFDNIGLSIKIPIYLQFVNKSELYDLLYNNSIKIEHAMNDLSVETYNHYVPKQIKVNGMSNMSMVEKSYSVQLERSGEVRRKIELLKQINHPFVGIRGSLEQISNNFVYKVLNNTDLAIKNYKIEFIIDEKVNISIYKEPLIINPPLSEDFP